MHNTVFVSFGSLIRISLTSPSIFFFFNDTATTEIYTLSLHDALPISQRTGADRTCGRRDAHLCAGRSEEHTSELQSHSDLVCRLLLEKKKKIICHPVVYRKTKKQIQHLNSKVLR